MPNATDYWLQGMQVANEKHRDYVANQQKNRDYAVRNKLYYGEDWRGDEKGDTDFGASESARKQRLTEDAMAAAEVYLGGLRESTVVDPRTVPGMSESDSDFGAPKAPTINPQPDAPRLVPVTNDLGSPSAVPATPVRVITPPELVNTDSAGEDGAGNREEMMARLSPEAKPTAQPDAPRYIPVENTPGAPPATPAVAPAVVPVPDITRDLGASMAPAARATSPVPNTSTFGAPPGQPTAREIFDRTDPAIRDNPSFRTALAAYEKDRLNKEALMNRAEEVARIRARVGEESNAIKRETLEQKKKSAEESQSEVKGLPVRLPDGSISEDHYGILGEGGAVHIKEFKNKKTSVDATPAALDRAIRHAETVIKNPEASEDDKAQAKARLGVILPQYYERMGVKLEPQVVTNVVSGTKVLGVPLTADKQVVSTNYVPSGQKSVMENTSEMVDVVDPSGRTGKIPKSNLKKALESGYRTR